MNTSTQLKMILTGMVLSILMVFSNQSLHAQFFGMYYSDSTTACINYQHDGYVQWSQPAGTYVNGDSLDFFIDWGDGNNNSYNDIQMSVWAGGAYASVGVMHTYITAGTFVVNITATDENLNVFNLTDTVIVSTNCGTVYGQLYLDDGDGVFDAGDVPTSAGVPITLTTNLGNYGTTSWGSWYSITNIDHTATSYEVEIDPAWLSSNGFSVVDPVSGTHNFTSLPYPGASINSFLLDCGGTYSDFHISGYGWGFRPTFTGHNYFYLSNFTCDGTPANVTITVTFDPLLTVTGCSMPGYSVVGNTVTANLTGVTNWVYHSIDYYVPAGTPIGTPLTFNVTATVTNYTDTYLANNSHVINCVVVNSYDPNDKSTDLPSNIDATSTEEILYNIRFQNTGSADAINIHITDTIDTQLDLNTFKLESMSHMGSYSLDPVTRIVDFQFPNIMLPAESVNEPLSHGYVRYSIQENPGLPVNSVIENTAYIYFDDNAPVITNTTANTNVNVGIDHYENNPLVIYPQPATDVVYISGINLEEVTSISMMDANGKVIRVMNGNMINTGISVSDLSSGLYLITVQTNEGPFTKKLCVKR